MCHSAASGPAQSVMTARACECRRNARWMVSSRAASSSRESTVTGAADLSVLSSAAARDTRTSLTAIESALAKRDLCERARDAARTAANSVQSAAMCARTVLLSGGTRRLLLPFAIPSLVV